MSDNLIVSAKVLESTIQCGDCIRIAQWEIGEDFNVPLVKKCVRGKPDGFAMKTPMTVDDWIPVRLSIHGVLKYAKDLFEVERKRLRRG